MDRCELRVIARVRSDFPEKFGVPRQAGLVPDLRARVVFEPEYAAPEALRGLEDFSHIWLIWGFSENADRGWSPTVRPPRLGGNARMGVFATRSPFRPNPVGLSCVKIEEIVLNAPDGPQIVVSGADLMDGTPIYDIKPYLPYADSHPEARGGFAAGEWNRQLRVECPEELLRRVPQDQRQTVLDILSQDPRPSYQHDPERVYGMEYAGMDIRFRVDGDVLEIIEIVSAGLEG